MLRAFIITTRKLLVPRPLPVYTLTLDATSSSSSAIYDVRRNNRFNQPHRSILPLDAGHNGYRLLQKNEFLTNGNMRWASEKKGFTVPNPSVIVCNMINMLKCVDLKDMKDSPPPAFWLSLAAGGSQVVIPLLEIIGGYCDVMTIFQLHLAAMTVAGASGINWGLAISKNPVPSPTWDTMKWVVTPTAIALVGLLLPYPLGFLVVGGAVVSSLYFELKSCAYPPWGNAMRLFMSLTTLFGLTLALSAYLLFHNRENKAKKVKKMKDAAAQTDYEENDEDEDKPKNGKNGGKSKNGKDGK